MMVTKLNITLIKVKIMVNAWELSESISGKKPPKLPISAKYNASSGLISKVDNNAVADKLLMHTPAVKCVLKFAKINDSKIKIKIKIKRNSVISV